MTLHKALGENGEKLDIEVVQEALSDHTGGVCSHRDDMKFGTL